MSRHVNLYYVQLTIQDEQVRAFTDGDAAGVAFDAAAHRVGLLAAQAGAVGHRAEEMIDVCDAPASGGFHLGKGGVGVPRVAADAPRPAGPYERLRSRQLRRDRGAGDAIEAEILF